jgi:hydrogenase maturation factor
MELNKIPERMVVRPRDIMNITGYSRSTTSRIMQKIRQIYGKEPGEWVTVHELCAVCGLNEEEVRKYLK